MWMSEETYVLFLFDLWPDVTLGCSGKWTPYTYADLDGMRVLCCLGFSNTQKSISTIMYFHGVGFTSLLPSFTHGTATYVEA